MAVTFIVFFKVSDEPWPALAPFNKVTVALVFCPSALSSVINTWAGLFVVVSRVFNFNA